MLFFLSLKENSQKYNNSSKYISMELYDIKRRGTMLKSSHKILEDNQIKKDEIKDETRTVDEIIEFHLSKIVTEMKSEKIINPKLPCIDESIELVMSDLKNYKYRFIDKRRILAGKNFYEYKINYKLGRMHFYKKRDNGKYISIRDYFNEEKRPA